MLKSDKFDNNSTLVGCIFIGIASTVSNIFIINRVVKSTAIKQIFKVNAVKINPTLIHTLNPQSFRNLKMQELPDPTKGEFMVKFNVIETEDVTITIKSLDGKIIEK